jgi:hypothetical protein
MENKTDNILKLLQKENEALKRIIKDKHIDNDSMNALLEILEIQRQQINFFEDGKPINYYRKKITYYTKQTNNLRIK